MFARVKAYFQETGSEMKRVSWASFPELRESTLVVIITVAVITAFVFVVDRGFGFIAETLIKLA